MLLLAVGWIALYRVVDPPFTFMTARDRLEGRHVEQDWRPLSALSPNLPRAVIAAEDAHFCQHHGFDIAAIREAAKRNAAGGRLRGGSTISQQTAKNVFLWPERSWLRKGLETAFTAGIEALWGKRRIMEVYLNVVEQGRGIYGAEAGARAAFGHSAARLTPGEAARLVAILPQPIKRSAGAPSRATRRYAGRIGPPDSNSARRRARRVRAVTPARAGDSARDPLLSHGIVTTADYLGTAVFAAQGALVAVAHGLDLFGVLVIAFIAALGGGIVRDVLIGSTPPAALGDWRYPVIAFGAAAATVALRLAGGAWPVDVVRTLDAAGLSLFAVAGARKAERLELAPVVAAMLGVVTATGGGVVRDLLLTTVPGVLRTDIYATAAFAGAAVMLGARRLGMRIVTAAIVGGLACFALRLAAIAFDWRLPVVR